MRAASAACNVPLALLKKLKHNNAPGFEGGSSRVDMRKLTPHIKAEGLPDDKETKLKIAIMEEKLKKERLENRAREGELVPRDEHLDFLVQVTSRIRNAIVTWTRTEWAPRMLGLTVPEMVKLMSTDANNLIDSIVRDIETNLSPPL